MASASLITREYLEFQSDRIEAVLASHRVPVRVHGGAVSPRWIRFHLTPALGARVGAVRHLSEELALALGAPDVRIARQGETLAVEVPRPDAEPVYLLRMLREMGPPPPLTACLGLADDGRPLLIRLPSPDVAHILVAGATGSGKTEVLRTLVVSLALNNRQAALQVALIDPKSRGLAPLMGLPHLIAPLASDSASAAALLDHLAAQMERRDVEGISAPRIVIIVDELSDLLMGGGETRYVASLLTRIAQRGREAGLHLVAGAQKPASALLGPLLKANFPVRLVGRVGSAEDARVASGIAASGAEKLTGRGDFLAVAGGQVTRFQAAFVAAKDWAEIHAVLRGEARLWST